MQQQNSSSSSMLAASVAAAAAAVQVQVHSKGKGTIDSSSVVGCTSTTIHSQWS
jgi:hypothetical protein